MLSSLKRPFEEVHVALFHGHGQSCLCPFGHAYGPWSCCSCDHDGCDCDRCCDHAHDRDCDGDGHQGHLIEILVPKPYKSVKDKKAFGYIRVSNLKDQKEVVHTFKVPIKSNNNKSGKDIIEIM